MSIEKIKYAKTGDFYDMHVPGWENYVANGIVNHNTGKTTTIAASNMIDCLTVPYFRALNTSVTAKQAELPFEMVMAWVEGNDRLEHLIDSISLRPYPTIKFKNYSEWVFRTSGMDARFIRGMEFDRINYDEAGLDFSGETIKVLRGRLRGERPDGTKRMGRLDVTTSPTDAPWLRERFEKGDKDDKSFDPKYYHSLRIATRQNTHLTPDMVSLMEAEYSDDMIDVELNALFPDYGMSMFPKSHLAVCTDQSLNDALEMALHPESGPVKKGYRTEEHPRYGMTLFEMPYVPGRNYVMAGDPGTDGPPHRNAGVVMVADVTERPNKLVYIDWVDGKGSYTPFLQSFKYGMQKYYPIFKGIDTTGTQKAIDELAFENHGIQVDGINFAKDKEAMLNCLINDVTEHNFRFPVMKGFQRQMSSYSRENESKLEQDLVMTIAQISFLSRYIPDEDRHDKQQQRRPGPVARNRTRRTNRINGR
jgi:hypothetical protein